MQVQTRDDSLSILRAIEQASQCINYYWPLSQFIACNPLAGFEKIQFEEAISKASDLFGATGYLPLAIYREHYETGRVSPDDLREAFADSVWYRSAKDKPDDDNRVKTTLCISDILDQVYASEIVERVNKELIKWCGAYFDKSQAQTKSSNENSLYEFWRRHAPFDLTLDLHGCRKWRENLSNLSHDSLYALATCISSLELEDGLMVPYLQRHLLQLPGWSSFLKWQSQKNGNDSALTDYLCIRLFYETQLALETLSTRHNLENVRWSHVSALQRNLLSSNTEGAKDSYASVWQDAFEINYRKRLLSALNIANSPKNTNRQTKLAQIVFCIDVRSEPIRRALEARGQYETIGFAGFFGFASRFYEFGSAHSMDLCPVLLTPQKEVREESSQKQAANSFLNFNALSSAALSLKKWLKSNVSSACGLVENAGHLSWFPLIGKTFFPKAYNTLVHALLKSFSGSDHLNTHISTESYSEDEKVAVAKFSLKGMGLTSSFAPIVVLMGHRSSSNNNPYAASLECGACGGHRGAYSARLACTILNDPKTRLRLADEGISIPTDTLFVAAEHNTTLDSFEFFDTSNLPDSKLAALKQIEADLRIAGEQSAKERLGRLPSVSGDGPDTDATALSCDWAQVYPEWGLAGNAAFIAAPRELTKGVDLGGRAFLHSYDHSTDENGSVLELIMTAPLVVAQWINAQYYFSTVDNNVFGSGSKVLHNVVGDFGVMQGEESDLRTGLPLQSVMSSESVLFHEPMRLLAVIKAPLSKIDTILSKHKSVSDLVSNRWIKLIAINPDDGSCWEKRGINSWRRVQVEKQAQQTKVPKLALV